MRDDPGITGLLDFWFSKDVRARWFDSTPEFDAALRRQYDGSWQQGRDGGLQDWELIPDGALALVILLDQFPLNMFRDQPESFSTETQSREVAARAIENGFDAVLADDRKAFLYLPFMHSESLADQDRSVELFEAAGLHTNLKWALGHREIVRRFGRFPHRNAILGRTSSAEELAWLASPEGFNP